MAAATQDRDGQRQPSIIAPYTGASGELYYKNTFMIRNGTSGTDGVVRSLTLAGSSRGYFLGVNADRVDLSAGLGSSQSQLRIWKAGEFTFAANGTGISSHIGEVAYGLDDNTAGISAVQPALIVGEIVAIPTSSTYRIRIDNAVGGKAGTSAAVDNNHPNP